MRNKFSAVKVDGKVMKMTVATLPFRVAGVFVTSESPEHAASSIRKVSAYRNRLINRGCEKKEDRHLLFRKLSKADYLMVVGL